MHKPGSDWSSLFMTRREMLSRCGMGFGSLGLMQLLASQGSLTASPSPSPNVRPLAAAAALSRQGETGY